MPSRLHWAECQHSFLHSARWLFEMLKMKYQKKKRKARSGEEKAFECETFLSSFFVFSIEEINTWNGLHFYVVGYGLYYFILKAQPAARWKKKGGNWDANLNFFVLKSLEKWYLVENVTTETRNKLSKLGFTAKSHYWLSTSTCSQKKN